MEQAVVAASGTGDDRAAPRPRGGVPLVIGATTARLSHTLPGASSGFRCRNAHARGLPCSCGQDVHPARARGGRRGRGGAARARRRRALARGLTIPTSATEFVLRPQPETIELGGRTAGRGRTARASPAPSSGVRQGERVRVRVENGLPEDTTVHWHGLRVAERRRRRARHAAAADQARRVVHLRVRPARRGHVLVPPARRHAARPRALRRADRRAEGRAARLRPRGRARARRLARRDRGHTRREAEGSCSRTACRCRAWT